MSETDATAVSRKMLAEGCDEADWKLMEAFNLLDGWVSFGRGYSTRVRSLANDVLDVSKRVAAFASELRER